MSTPPFKPASMTARDRSNSKGSNKNITNKTNNFCALSSVTTETDIENNTVSVQNVPTTTDVETDVVHSQSIPISAEMREDELKRG